MSSEKPSVIVRNLSKCYQIYDSPRDRLKQFVVPRIRESIGLSRSQYFREFWALKDVSFEINCGETVGIVGRNGSGKSTLLQMICGTLTPTVGNVETRGRIAALLELGSGFNPEFTGRDNVYMNAALLGLTRGEVDDRFDDIAAFADIGQFIEQPTMTYSSGMVVRLAFAVQAIIKPDIFVVDEALAVGDEKFQRKCYARLDELKSQGSSILFVSHSPSSVIELCDRTLLLEGGQRLLYNTAPKVIRAYQKLIYAPEDHQEKLVEQYRSADLSGSDIETDGSNGSNSSDLVPAGSTASLDAFDPGLIPDTTTEYPVQGAQISSIQIFNGQKQVVNVLEARESYEFVVSGHFMADAGAAYFGLHIRSISGVVITGQRHPEEGKYVENLQKGQSFRISFSFNMDLLPGTYFVGGGVWSNDEPNCLHRIMDAIMFRVMPVKKQKSFGYVDVSADEPHLEIV